jgi:hypothetical protein
MAPAESLQMEFQRTFGTGETCTATLYIAEPLTTALTSAVAICRSTTEPLRT